MSNVHPLRAGSTGIHLEAIRMSTKPRKAKRPPTFVFDAPALAPDRIRFDERATLRPVAWGKRDELLGAAVCGNLRDTMPASGKGLGTPWTWTPRLYVPRWVGYAGIAAVVLCTLAGFAR